MMLAFEEEVIKVMFAHEPLAERLECEKDQICNQMVCV